MMLTKRIACLTTATLLFSMPGSSSQRLDEALNLGTPEKPEEVVVEVETEPETKAPTETVLKWECKTCTPQEKKVLAFLQGYGITDRAALATILGNIKQESNFINNICEGGARTGYHGCHRGGFGLIQWTTKSRYDGLGWYARKHGLDPNGMRAQLGWMVEEQQWRKVDYIWKTPGKSIDGYMRAAYRWLGWGIHGARTSFSYQYFDKLSGT